MKYLLVTRLQDMIYFDVLENAYPNTFAPISKKQSGVHSIPIVELMPKIMPYHPAFITGRHLYTQSGVRFSSDDTGLLDTYNNIVTGIDHAKYVIYDNYLASRYGTMLLTYFICNKCPVLLTKGCFPTEIELFYSQFTHLVDDPGIQILTNEWNSMRSKELAYIADDVLSKFKLATANMPLLNREQLDQLDQLEPREQLDQLEHTCSQAFHSSAIVCPPLDMYVSATKAETYHDKQGHDVLKLPKQIGDLPAITVIIPPFDSTDVKLNTLLKYNMNTTKYPRHLITYIHCNNDGLDLRSHVSSATDIVIIMAADTLYFPHSIYAKVKLLEIYSAVGSNQNYNYCPDIGKGKLVTDRYPGSNTMAFRKSFFLQYADCHSLDAYFYDNRWDHIAVMPYNFNCVNICFNMSVEEYQDLNGIEMPAKALDMGTRDFIITKLTKREGVRV